MIDEIKQLILKIISKLVNANQSAKLQGVQFGNNCSFGKNNKFMSEPYLIKIGDDFSSSSNVNFVTHDGSMRVIRVLYPQYKNMDLFGKILIKNNVFIGVNVTILPNTIIDNNVIVGAGSIVKGHLKENSVYAGIPAKFICTVDEYLEKNECFFDKTKHLDKSRKKEYLMKKYNYEK